MHIIYYAWILQNISQLIGIFIPKELIVHIIHFMRSAIIKYNDAEIDMDRITTIPVQDGSYLYYDTDELLFKTTEYTLYIRTPVNTYPQYIPFDLNNGYEHTHLEKMMMRIDNLMSSAKMQRQLFRGRGSDYIYQSCISSNDTITMLLCKETNLIKIINKREENIPIDDVAKIVTHGSLVEFIYSLKIIITPPTYKILPEIKIIKYVDPSEKEYNYYK